MGKAYYFIERSGNCNQCGSEYMRWAFSTEYTSKTALKKAYTTGRRSVRMADIYTPQQLLQEFGIVKAKHIIEEVLQYQPELCSRKEA